MSPNVAASGALQEPYSPNDDMLDLLDEIAEAEDLGLRFWAACNLHLETFAGGGGAFAIDDAVAGIGDFVSLGEPGDEDLQPITDPEGHLVGVRRDDGDVDEPDDVDRLIYAIVSQTNAVERREGLLELVTLSLSMTEAEPFGGPLKQSRFWPEVHRTI